MMTNDSKKNPDEDLVSKNALTGGFVLLVVIGMVGLSFAAVPLYNMFCRVTGFGGTTQVALVLPGIILDRSVTVKFNADVNRQLPWDFRPQQREIDVKLGAKGFATFSAHNRLARPSAGTALYNVTPPKVGKYFHKIQCFCFDEQILGPGQKVSMPVMFYVDPAMDEDPGMNDVSVITLSYTFFKSESSKLEQALDAFYNDEDLSQVTH